MQEPAPVTRDPAASPLSVPAAICVVAGVLAAIGSFLPWANVSANFGSLGLANLSESIGGMDGDGPITLVGGIILIVVGVLLFVGRGRWVMPLGIVGALAGLLVAGTAIYDLTTLKTTTTHDFAESIAQSAGVPVEQAEQLFARFNLAISVSFGLWLVAIAGIVGIVGALVALSRRSAVEPTTTAPGTYAPPPTAAPAPPPAQPGVTNPPPPPPPAPDEGGTPSV